MGTRADFYTGRGDKLEWLGSCAWDGHADTMAKLGIASATTEEAYRAAVDKRLAKDDGTRPEQGWPWPWDTSATTDYAYTWDDGKVWLSPFGRRWIPAAEYLAMTDEESEAYHDENKSAAFPDMSDRKNVTLGQRSGVIVLGG